MEEREGTNNNNNNNTSSFGLNQQQQHHVAPLALTPPPPGYGHMDPPRSNYPNLFSGGPSNTSAVVVAAPAAPPPVAQPSVNAAAPPTFSLTMPVENSSSSSLKKKRGRPRKYNLDGSLNVNTLSPNPISSSVPLMPGFASSKKRGKGRARGRGKGKPRGYAARDVPLPVSVSVPSTSNWRNNTRPVFQFNNNTNTNTNNSLASGAAVEIVNPIVTTYLVTVNAGEDVTMKIMAFSQLPGSRTISLVSANGAISNVTLRRPTGTLTYEGNFEILSLAGSFTLSESGGTRSTSGGMCVSLSGVEGTVFGGVLAGPFIAAGTVQVLIGRYLTGQEVEGPRLGKYVVQALPRPQPAAVSSFSNEPSTSTGHGYYANNTANNHTKDLLSTQPEDEDEEDEEGMEDGHDDDDEGFGDHTESDNDVPPSC